MKALRPRPASVELRKRIFAEEAEETCQAGAWRSQDLMRWIVPAVGCFLLATSSLMHAPVNAQGSRGSISEQQLAFSLGAGLEHNNVPATTLEWTFGAPSASSNDSFIRTETNTLRK